MSHSEVHVKASLYGCNFFGIIRCLCHNWLLDDLLVWHINASCPRLLTTIYLACNCFWMIHTNYDVYMRCDNHNATIHASDQQLELLTAGHTDGATCRLLSSWSAASYSIWCVLLSHLCLNWEIKHIQVWPETICNYFQVVIGDTKHLNFSVNLMRWELETHDETHPKLS